VTRILADAKEKSGLGKSAPRAAVVPKSEHAPAYMVTTRRALSPGETVRAVDVELRPLDTPLRGVMPLSQVSEAVGQEVTRPVAAGQPLDARWLQRPLLVRRGEAVVVYARAAGVCVRTTAKATQDASLGDLVTLESLENRQRFSARVTGLQQADVYASGNAAEMSPSARTTRPARISPNSAEPEPTRAQE
jgi:flagella basal body P-ring formation protein FlgA